MRDVDALMETMVSVEKGTSGWRWQRTGASKPSNVFVSFNLIVRRVVCQTEMARVSGILLKTVQRWIRCYREAGLSGWARKVRSDEGQPRRLEWELVLLIEGLVQVKAWVPVDEY